MEFVGIHSISDLIKKADINKKSDFNAILNEGLKLVSKDYADAAAAGWVNPATAGKAWDTFKSEGLGAAKNLIQSEGQQNAMQDVAKDVWKAITTPQQSATSSDPWANYIQAYQSGGMNAVTSYMKQYNIPLPKDMKQFEQQIRTKSQP